MSARLPMKKRTPGRAKRLVDRRVDQSQILLFPENLTRTYDMYAAFRSGALFHKRKSFKDIVGHGVQLMIWFALLTTFFVCQRAMLHTPSLHATAPISAPLTASFGPQKTAERIDRTRI